MEGCKGIIPKINKISQKNHWIFCKFYDIMRGRKFFIKWGSHMNLSALFGNQRLKSQLAQQQGGTGLSHAYIVAGCAGTGRHTLVNALTAAALCREGGVNAPCGHCPQCKKVFSAIHPDVVSVGEDKPLLVDEVRDIRSDVYIRPNEGIRKVYILWNSDKMKEPPQNALLKVLEEGPSYALFILVADNAGGILDTLRSRSELLSLAPAQEIVDSGLEDRVTPIVEAIARGDELATLLAISSVGKVEKEQTIPLVSLLQTRLTQRATQGGDSRRLTRSAILCAKMVEGARQNVGLELLLNWLSAEIFTS